MIGRRFVEELNESKREGDTRVILSAAMYRTRQDLSVFKDRMDASIKASRSDSEMISAIETHTSTVKSRTESFECYWLLSQE